MGILDSIVEWIATQIMNLLDLVTGSVLGALGCDMSTFLRYFPGDALRSLCSDRCWLYPFEPRVAALQKLWTWCGP